MGSRFGVSGWYREFFAELAYHHGRARGDRERQPRIQRHLPRFSALRIGFDVSGDRAGQPRTHPAPPSEGLGLGVTGVPRSQDYRGTSLTVLSFWCVMKSSASATHPASPVKVIF